MTSAQWVTYLGLTPRQFADMLGCLPLEQVGSKRDMTAEDWDRYHSADPAADEMRMAIRA